MKRIWTWLLGALWITLSLFHGTPLKAQTSGPELQVEAAWGARTRGAWSELRVTITQGGGAWQGELVIKNPHEQVTYRIPLDLPAQARKVYRIPVFVGQATSLRLDVRDTRGNEQKPSQLITFTAISDEQRFCVVMSPQAFSLSRLCDNFFYLEQTAALPEWIPAWDSVDVLVLDGISTADLTSAQQQALETWVSMGGQLILGGGDALRGTLEGLPSWLRVAAVSGPAQTLTAFPLLDAPAHTWMVVPLQKTNEAEALLNLEDGRPLAIKQGVGMGEVVITGFELKWLTQTQWLGALINTRRVPAIVLPLTYSAWGKGTEMASYPTVWDLAQVPREDLPSVIGVFFVLIPLVYVLLMGPLAWVVMRRTRQPLAVWLFLPAVTLGVTLLVFVILSTAQAGVFPMEHTISIVFVPDVRTPARVIHYTAFYAPQWQKFTFATSRWARPWLGAYITSNFYTNTGDFFPVDVMYQGETTYVQMRNFSGMVTWAEEEIVTAPPLQMDLSLVHVGGEYKLQGAVSSAQALKHVYLIWGSSQLAYAIAPTLSAGQVLNVNQALVPATLPSPLSNLAGASATSMYYAYPPSKPVQGFRGDSHCFVVAIADSSAASEYALIGTGRQTHEQIWVYRVSCPPVSTTSSGEVVIIPAQWLVFSTDHWLEDNQWLPINSYELMSSVEYVASLPLNLTQIEALTIDLTLRYGHAPFEVIRTIEAYDWAQKNWVELPSTLLTDGTLTLSGEEAMRFIDSGAPRIGFRVYNRTSSTGTSEYVSFALTLRAKP